MFDENFWKHTHTHTRQWSWYEAGSVLEPVDGEGYLPLVGPRMHNGEQSFHFVRTLLLYLHLLCHSTKFDLTGTGIHDSAIRYDTHISCGVICGGHVLMQHSWLSFAYSFNSRYMTHERDASTKTGGSDGFENEQREFEWK